MIALARMNAPIKRNISGSANGANTSLAGATRSTTAAAAPSIAVTGMGSASVTQSTTTAARIAARRCASGVSVAIGVRRMATKTIGARTKPTMVLVRPGVASNSVLMSLLKGVEPCSSAAMAGEDAPLRSLAHPVTAP